MDDIELIFSFYYFASNLPISHYYLIKTQPLENSELEVIPSKRFVSLDDKSETTAYLKIKSFNGTANEMDSIFSVIKKKNYLNLIVDLRNNIGGNVEAGMEFAKNVVDTTIIGGIFLTQKWFANHKNIPELNEYNQFHHFTASNYDLLKQGIHEKQGIVLKVIPNKDPFKGQLFILTNNNTASTCEPIVYSLKNHNRATIIGESTAGAMLSGESFDLQNDYSLFVPTADYYTSDGYRIDQKGVKPNIEIKADQALEYVLNNLIDP
jgi:C-terminal processing protease CtpA/Prc